MWDSGKFKRLDVLQLLQEVRSGTDNAADRLMSVLYADLRRIVRGVMASEGQHRVLQPAAIVSEAFVGLVQSRSREFDWQDRSHFLALAGRQIRLVLRDYAKVWSSKAGGRLAIALDTASDGAATSFEFSAVDKALEVTTERAARIVRFVEMDCFGGMSDQEIALVEHIPTSKAKREREFARIWLTETLLVGSPAPIEKRTHKGTID